MQQQFLLRAEHVVKQFGSYLASDDVSFEMPYGTILGMLGPNGAGKTTLIRIITGITLADSGKVFIGNKAVGEETRLAIGYMPEERGLYKKMKVGEQLLYLGQLRGLTRAQTLDRIRYWFERLNMQGWYDKKTEDLSKGMQQKVQFVATVLHEPKLIILDEPFSGLDPINANLLKDEISHLHEQGTGIIFSTHRMEQVEEICHNIILIDKGKNILSGSVSDIKEQYKEHQFSVRYQGQWPEHLPNGVTLQSLQSQQAIVSLEAPANTNQLLHSLIEQQVNIVGFEEILPSLNDIFIRRVAEFETLQKA